MVIAASLDSMAPAATEPTIRPRPAAMPAGARRFERVALTSVFGDPRDRRSWSGAPASIAAAMERLGVTVEAIHPHLGTIDRLAVAALDLASGHGRPLSGEQILRSARARRLLAHRVADATARLGVHHVLHTGSFDLPAADLGRGICHYLYCDHSWGLSRPNHPQASRYPTRALAAYERSERAALRDLTHIFTFGAYVRDNLIAHYGVPAERVTAIGSGMGDIEPYRRPKDYTHPSLLFVAKHLFEAKGGVLLLDAFGLALERRPDLRLTIVGDERSRRFVPSHRNIELHAHLPWAELQRLYRTSTLLVQPMLNDPWGQVYLEALLSRTPVVGLRRNGLPEIAGEGRFGFMVDRAEPEALADTILDALSDPARLAAMARAGQRHVLDNYSWDRAAEKIVFLN
jgi:glycosyltransferase involved in cell wall biosynthesis